MAVGKWGRDYHLPRHGTTRKRGPGTLRRVSAEACSLGYSPRGIVEAIYPVSAHLSTRPFGPDRSSSLRPHCGMSAEFTENLTLSRAHALGDSPWSLERRSLAARSGPAIWLLRMRLAAIRLGTHRMGYAILEAF
jgi:hypothetical protein